MGFAAFMLIAASVALAGCAGRHALPSTRYSSADASQPPIVNVAFDQNGAIYPRSDSDAGLTWPYPLRRTTGPFSLPRHFADTGQLERYDQNRILEDFAPTIEAHLADDAEARLVVLIHGFNNSYEQASTSFSHVRTILAEDASREVILQVYWDGLQDPPLGFLPFWFWPDSMTYSNRAGQCGLRRLMALLPEGTDVTFVTHSRGAAVALSALADPRYDDGIRTCDPAPAPPAQLGDVRIASFAPAIGDGHVLQGGQRGLAAYPQIDGMVVGFGPNDTATDKHKYGVDISERFMGDTRFAANDAYYRQVEAGSAGRLQRETFLQSEHAWPAYLGAYEPYRANSRIARCVLWAAFALARGPEGCAVRRSDSGS